MTTLLVVHHTTSPRLQAIFEAVMSGATDEAIGGVTVVARPALAATAVDVLQADGYLLGTPANLGSISGALKHFRAARRHVRASSLGGTRGRGRSDEDGDARLASRPGGAVRHAARIRLLGLELIEVRRLPQSP